MPFLPLSPSTFFEDEDLRDFVAEVSEALRADALVRPALDQLVGNQWLEAERAMEAFLWAVLFMESTPLVDADWLTCAAEVLSLEEIERLGDLILGCSFRVFPLHTAAAVIEFVERLVEAMRDLAGLDDGAICLGVRNTQTRLQAGALMGRL